MKSITAMGLSLTALSLTAFAAAPSKDEIVAAKATFTGTLKPMTDEARKVSNGADWACTATVKGDGAVQVKWYSSTVTYKGVMGPAGGRAGNPIVMNAEGDDKSQVRFQWNSASDLQVEWWPNMAAKAGQTQHKPAHVKGSLAAIQAAATANGPQPSTFQKSCSDYKVGLDAAGLPVLQASCFKSDGTTKATSYVALRGFHNVDGRISAGQNVGGQQSAVSTFQKSCKDMRFEVKGGNPTLLANCQSADGGSWKPASSILWDVHNMDGQLKHRVAGNDAVKMPVKLN